MSLGSQITLLPAQKHGKNGWHAAKRARSKAQHAVVPAGMLLHVRTQYRD
jgi:hypothetical protein